MFSVTIRLLEPPSMQILAVLLSAVMVEIVQIVMVPACVSAPLDSTDLTVDKVHDNNN